MLFLHEKPGWPQLAWDGDGRAARAIADMALARADGAKERFYSMFLQIDTERKDYSLQLEAAQSAVEEQDVDAGPLVTDAQPTRQ